MQTFHFGFFAPLKTVKSWGLSSHMAWTLICFELYTFPFSPSQILGFFQDLLTQGTCRWAFLSHAVMDWIAFQNSQSPPAPRGTVPVCLQDSFKSPCVQNFFIFTFFLFHVTFISQEKQIRPIIYLGVLLSSPLIFPDLYSFHTPLVITMVACSVWGVFPSWQCFPS